MRKIRGWPQVSKVSKTRVKTQATKHARNKVKNCPPPPLFRGDLRKMGLVPDATVVKMKTTETSTFGNYNRKTRKEKFKFLGLLFLFSSWKCCFLFVPANKKQLNFSYSVFFSPRYYLKNLEASKTFCISELRTKFFVCFVHHFSLRGGFKKQCPTTT